MIVARRSPLRFRSLPNSSPSPSFHISMGHGIGNDIDAERIVLVRLRHVGSARAIDNPRHVLI